MVTKRRSSIGHNFDPWAVDETFVGGDEYCVQNAGGGCNKSVCRIPMINCELLARHCDVDSQRVFADGRSGQGVCDPTFGACWWNLQAPLSDQDQRFPYADNREMKLVFWVGEGGAHVRSQSLGCEQAPDPDMGVEYETHLAQRLPVLLGRGRRDDVARDLGRACHHAEPWLHADISRRFDFGDRLAALRNKNWLAGTADLFQDSKASCLEFWYRDCFHGFILL